MATKFEIHAITFDGEKQVLVSTARGYDFQRVDGPIPAHRVGSASTAKDLLRFLEQQGIIGNAGDFQRADVAEITDAMQICKEYTRLVKDSMGELDYKALRTWAQAHPGVDILEGIAGAEILMDDAFKAVLGRFQTAGPADRILWDAAFDLFRKGE